MTTKVSDESKKNAVIMGRNTYFGIPPSKRPLPNRLNIVLSKTATSTDYPEDVILCRSLAEAMDLLNSPKYSTDIENVWIVGGSAVYKESMQSAFFHRLYFTEIKANFECDTFFPSITNEFQEVIDADIPAEEQEENGIKYQYKVYEKV